MFAIMTADKMTENFLTIQNITNFVLKTNVSNEYLKFLREKKFSYLHFRWMIEISESFTGL